ncbi:MAG: GAF domain-containing protein [Alcanivoracaceae bacterium]|nr:GAF domain-containing protein [Alcanivoracaceae bacterium]
MSLQTTKITTDDKNKLYKLLAQQCEGLFHGEKDLIANAANLSSLLYHSLDQVNWVGFYILQNDELVLGPFHGQVACTRIPLGQGVCGTAFSQNNILRVADVNAFKGHIACDSNSASEIVLPLNIDGKTIGVLDIDSPVLDRFNHQDQTGLATIAQIYCQSVAKN